MPTLEEIHAQYRREDARQLRLLGQSDDNRRRRGRHLAEGYAQLLKYKYGATRVVLFGSIANENKKLHSESDIDLAYEGIPGVEHFKAYGDLNKTTFKHEFDVQLVDLNGNAPERLKEKIERKGIQLVPKFRRKD